jgi:hypothetical protein
MFTLVLGPGGPLRRLLGEVVPFLVGIVVAWPVAVFAGPVGGIAAGLLAAFAVSALLRVVRARPRWRRVYRFALLAHVLFWSVLGWGESSPAPAAPPGPPEAVHWAGPRAFRAGAADVPFALPPHATLGGWGQPPRRVALPPAGGVGVLGRLARAEMAERDAAGRARVPMFREPDRAGQALSARALVLVPEGGGATLAFVRLDLVSSDAWLAEEVVRRTEDLGVTPATLVLSATHTHSGVGGYAREPMSTLLATDHFAPAVFEAVAAAAAASVRQAVGAARPARLAFVRARDRLPDGETILAARRGARQRLALDDRVTGVRVDAEAGGTLALLLGYAVHPVVLRRDSAAFDRDLAGAVEDAVAARLTGRPLVLFLQGALGDVAPRFGRSGDAARAMAEAAERFASAVGDDLAAGPAFDRLHVRAARVERDLGDPRMLVTLGDRGLVVADAGLDGPFRGSAAGCAFDALALPANALVWSLGLPEMRVVGTLRGAAGVSVNLRRQVTRRTYAVGALMLEASSADGASRARLPVLWLPGEPTQDLGAAWRAGWAGTGDEPPMIVALANGSLGYVVTGTEHRTGGYEAMATLFGPDTDRLLTEALDVARMAVVGDR